MQQRKKKSLVEQKNSWEPFVTELRGALKAKDYRRQTICGILRTLDAEVSLWPGSLLRYLFGGIIGSGFTLGRQCLYADIVKRFLAKNAALFKGAPLVVIQEFNRLIKTIFSQKVARQLQLEETLARRKLSPEDKLLQRGKTAQKHLQEYVTEAMKQRQALPIVKETTQAEEKEVPELIFQVKKARFQPGLPLDARTKEFFEDVSATYEIEEQVIAEVEKAALSFGQFVRNALTVLPATSLGSFQDLAAEVHALPTVLYFDAEEVSKLCSVTEEERKALIAHKEEAAREPFKNIVQRATRLKNEVEAIIEELARAKASIKPLLKKKDVKAQVEILLNELELLSLHPDVLSQKTAEMERILHEKRIKIEKLLASFRTEYVDLFAHLEKLQLEAHKLKLAIMYARWEFFSQHTPYADLNDLVKQELQLMLSTLSLCDEELIVGEKSFQEIQTKMLESLYTYNVRLVRVELLSRSLRLKDIRIMVEKELLTLDRQIHLIKLAGQQSDMMIEERNWLYAFLKKLYYPYDIFQNTCDPESINVLFRYFWMDLDRYRIGTERRKNNFLKLEKSAQLIQTLKNLFDAVEHVFVLKIPSEEPPSSIFARLEKYDEFSLFPLVAAFPYAQKIDVLVHIKQLSERKKNLETFARAIQAIKTFEPERMEALLEAFSMLPFAQNLSISLEQRLHEIERMLDRFEEAIFCELGLLDTQSRMETGYAFDALVEEAKRKIPEATAMALSLLQEKVTKGGLVGMCAALFLEEKEQPRENIFASARATTFLFLQNRLLSAAEHPGSLGKPVLLLFLFQKLLLSLSKKIPPEKAQKLSELFSFSRTFFYLIFPKPLPKEMSAFLKEFSSRFKALAPDSEMPIFSEFTFLEKEFDATISWDVPALTFVPGDLSFFLENYK